MDHLHLYFILFFIGCGCVVVILARKYVLVYEYNFRFRKEENNLYPKKVNFTDFVSCRIQKFMFLLFVQTCA